MEKTSLGILHLDTVPGWRGGQQQVVNLLDGLHQKGLYTRLICPAGSRLAAYCQEHGLPFYTINVRSELDAAAAWRIAAYMRKNHYNIIHSHSAHATATGMWVKFFNRKIRHVTTRRVDFSVRKPVFGSAKYNNKYLDKIVCISKEIERVLLADGVPAAKLERIHDGIDTHKFDKVAGNPALKKQFNIPAEHLVVGTVAALAGHKDYPTLLRAAQIVLRDHEQVTFCCLGDGPDEKILKKMAVELKLGPRFIFAGFHKNVGQFLKMFDLFVLSSKKEGLGTTLLDAQAVGLPVIATKAGGIPEIVVDQKNGILVPKQNPRELARAISQLLENEALRKKYALAAGRDVLKFDASVMVEAYIDLYKKITLPAGENE